MKTTPEEKNVYTTEEIQTQLRLGRSKTYEFIEEVYRSKEPFPVLKIGKQYRVPKKAFDAWLDGATNGKV